MFGIGMPELLIILAVALIVIGPKKLPELAKSLGRALGEFKKATNDLKDSIYIDSEIKDVKNTFNQMKSDPHTSRSKASKEENAATEKVDKRSENTPADPLDKVKSAFDEMNNTATDPSADPSETKTESRNN